MAALRTSTDAQRSLASDALWGWGARLALGVTGAAAVATALAAGVIAVIAIVKGERSLLLLAPLLFGAFWVIFVLGEFLSPH